MQPYTPRPASTDLSHLVMRVYPSDRDVDNTFTLYEDDGISLDYQKGVYATTALRYSQVGDLATVVVNPAVGDYPGQVKRRSYTLQLPALKDGTKVKVNGKNAKVVYDDKTGCHTVAVPATSVDRTVTIQYTL